MKQLTKSKETIIKEAAKLFAQKSYSAVGIREISKNANVNISMISYYFNGKMGILKEIITLFFDSYAEAIEASFTKKMSLEERISVLVRNIVFCAKENENMFKVAFFELPYDFSEIKELRAENINKIRSLFSKYLFEEVDIDEKIYPYLPVLGPAIISMVFSHFTMKPVLQNVFDFKQDDAFFNTYADLITRLLLKGLPETIQEIKV